MITTFYKIAVPPPLDIVGGAAVAVGVRKLYSGYMGKCMRIRRSSDNAEQDIGFNGLDLDVAAFSAFVGAGTGYITTLYDQSGNGRNATQATAANQPILALNVQNGKSIIQFVAAYSTFLSFGTALGKPANYTNISCFTVDNTSSTMFVFGGNNSTNTNAWGGLYANRILGSPNRLPFGNISYFHADTVTNTGSFNTTNALITVGALSLISDAFATGNAFHKLRDNGVVSSLLDTNGGGTINGGIAPNFSLGRVGDFASQYFDGYFTDLIQYHNKLNDTQMSSLEQSYNDYYAIF